MSHAEVKRARSLHQKKERQESRRFLVQGRKVVSELLASSVRCEVVLATDEGATFIAHAAEKARVPVVVLPPHQLDRAGTFDSGNELVAIAVEPEPPAFRALADGELVLALDEVHDPRNMGSLIRIADWFGIRRVLCSPGCIDVYNPKVVSSTMGSLFRVEVRRGPLAEELERCRTAGASIYLASMDGTPVFDARITRPAVLVLGSESHGLSESLRAMNASVISIPRLGGAESLNVAMAAAALCTELTRPGR